MALLYLSPWCLVTVIVLWLFLTVRCVDLMFVVFPDQTHLILGLKARLSAVHVALPNQICMMQCACDAVGRAYPVGLQVVLYAIEYAE